jgi:flagellar M-ring protein FliF
VPYTVSEGGGTIRVPSGTAGDLRLQLAGAGLPSGGGNVVGMEIFDKTNLGITDFAQKLNYQRALEGELTKTITRLGPVESARVHLVLPAERLFTSQQRDTTASVVIKLKPAARLTDDQVTNIRFLVSKSVEGLKPENVAVVDANGNALGKLDVAGQGERSEQAATRLQVQRQRESEMENKIQGMLTQVLGANRAVVRANINLDWNEIRQNVETYGAGQPVSSKDARESFSGTGAEVPAPGGVPGTASNIPNYQAVAAGGTGTSTYNKSDVTTNFQPNKDVQAIVRAPGEVKNVSIAVMVDQGVQAAQVDQITQVVTAAAGIQAARGDQVSVVTLPFDNTLNQQLIKQQEEQTLMDYVQLGLRLGGIVIGLGGLFLLFRMMSNAVRPKQAQVVVTEAVSLPGGTAGLLPATTVQAQLAHALEASRSREDIEQQMREELAAQVREELRAEIRGEIEQEYGSEIEEKRREEEVVRAAEMVKESAAKREQMRQAVMKLATSKPETLADVLNTWLEQSRSAQPVQARRATSALN